MTHADRERTAGLAIADPDRSRSRRARPAGGNV
jgi:hypothetical protein